MANGQNGAIAGAAIGTAIFPGVGTAIGGGIGGAVSSLFGKKASKPKPPPPPWYETHKTELLIGAGVLVLFVPILILTLKK